MKNGCISSLAYAIVHSLLCKYLCNDDIVAVSSLVPPTRNCVRLASKVSSKNYITTDMSEIGDLQCLTACPLYE